MTINYGEWLHEGFEAGATGGPLDTPTFQPL